MQHVRQHLGGTFAQRNRFAKKRSYEIRREITAEVSKKLQEVYPQAISIQATDPQ
jgi:hypothetical protein